METNRIKLPAEITQTLVGMLSPTERPLAVLCVYRVDTGPRRMVGRLRAGTVTDGERALFKLTNDGNGFWSTAYMYSTKDLVHMALAMGFGFRSEADRARWQAGEDFELYRDAVRALR